MPSTVERTISGMSAYPAVGTSPATWTSPVVTRVSTATRLVGSCASSASRMASLIWSQILSGWPSVTDSEVNSRWVTALLSQRLLASPRGGRARTSGPLSGAPAGVEDGDGVARPAEDRSAGDVVDHEQVAPLAGELRAGVREDVA